MKHRSGYTAWVFFLISLLFQSGAVADVARGLNKDRLGSVPAPSKPVPPRDKPVIELVFVLDTTGSMGGLIQAAKDKIWSIANTMATAKPAPEIRIGLVGYRDRGDAYVTTLSEMTPDLDRVYQTLMEYRAEGGGDGPESVNQALYDAVHKNTWSTDSKRTYKVIFLVGDAPPHMDYANDIPYAITCDAAARKGIIINTIQCGAMTETVPFWKDIARRCDGTYFQVSQDGDANAYETPYDTEISKTSKRLEETKLYYGDRSFRTRNAKKLEAVKDIYASASPSAVAKRSSFNLSASGSENFLGEQELVDSVTRGKVNLDDIKKEELPEPLQKMTPAERKKRVEALREDRKKITHELKILSEKRQAYIEAQVRKEKGKGENSLDMKLYRCIKAQASKKSITYTDSLKY
jgi:Mg-chelatase subunit ChlD